MIAMDLDGTILRADQSIHPSLPDAFERARQAGIQLVIATGRAYQSTVKIAERIGFEGPMICSNGSHVLNEAQVTIGTEFLEKSLQRHILEYANEHDLHVSAYGERGISTLKDSDWLTKYKQLVRGLDIPVLGFDGVMPQSLFKTVLICDELELPNHRQNLSFLERDKLGQMTESGPEYLEILPLNANKGNGLGKLARSLNLRQPEIAAIGDYRNDLEMLSWVGTPGSVENALPEVQSLAQFVVKSNEEGGVAEFIDQCILLNSRG